MSWPPKGKWSPLCRISETTWGKRWIDLCRNGTSGVYRLIALTDNRLDVVPAPLDRVCGIDPTGTLYIGASRSLRTRLGTLVRTHDPSKMAGGHAVMSAKLRRRFPPERLAITWRCREPPEMVRNFETELIQDYQARFGELPPVNAQG
jgi:hypothetical protein